MIDLRKNNKTELNEKVLEFIELLENDGAKVEIKKSYYLTTVMKIEFSDGFEFNNDFHLCHYITDIKKFYNTLFKDYVRQSKEMQRIFGNNN